MNFFFNKDFYFLVKWWHLVSGGQKTFTSQQEALPVSLSVVKGKVDVSSLCFRKKGRVQILYNHRWGRNKNENLLNNCRVYLILTDFGSKFLLYDSVSRLKKRSMWCDFI